MLVEPTVGDIDVCRDHGASYADALMSWSIGMYAVVLKSAQHCASADPASGAKFPSVARGAIEAEAQLISVAGPPSACYLLEKVTAPLCVRVNSAQAEH